MKTCTLYSAEDLRIVEQPDVPTPLGPDEVRIRARMGGICGSDLHYFHEGCVGNFAVREPLVLGHEVSGEVSEVGAAVTRVRPGQRVAVNPSLPCNACDYCLSGMGNQCRHMRFFGSAALMPHIQGVFKETLRVPEVQCVPVPDELDFSLAAMGEPLAVALHAVQRAMPITGRRVLITGAGPIGCLVVLAARHAGAATITVTDLDDAPLEMACRVGADETVNVAKDPERLTAYGAGKGHFDTVIECSGSIQAMDAAVDVARAGGVIVQVGFPPVGGQPFPINKALVKEIEYRGSFRFHPEFEWAIDFIARGRIDVTPLLTGTYPMENAVEAFKAASDRSRHMKVQLEL
jgi:L-idonate 5-dehydrogenase